MFAVVALCAAAVLIAHSQYYTPFMADDSFISFVYAQRFADGLGLTWADGQRVEGYSNLLWVLLLACFSKLGIDLVPVARALGTLCCLAAQAGAVFALTLLPERKWGRKPSWVGAWVAGLGTALCGPIAVWAIGGLEQGLLAGLVTWSWVLLAWRWRECMTTPRAAVLPGVLFGLACWTRPDTPILVVCATLGAALYAYRHPKLTKALAIYAAVPAAFFAAQLLFRLAYYHEWVPNTAHVKVAVNSVRINQGRDYIIDGMTSLAPLVVLAMLGFERERSQKGRTLVSVLATSIAVWCGYWVLVGGDIFPAYRHFVVLAPALSILAGLAVSSLQKTGLPVLTLSLLSLGYLGSLQFKDSQNQRAVSERWEWTNRRLALTIKQAFGEAQPLFASESAGAIVYYAGVPFVDMLGLNDTYTAKHPPKQFGRGMLGHDLGNVDYLEKRSPDGFVIGLDSRTGGSPFWITGELGRQKWFRQAYREIEISNPSYDPPSLQNIWVKLDGRIGIQQTDDRVTVPAWLLSPPGAFKKAGRGVLFKGVLVADLPAATEYRLSDVPLNPGSWTVRAEPSAELRISPVPPNSMQQASPRTFVVSGGDYDFAVTSEHPTKLKQLIFERSP